ncbi:MAG: ABC transporter substrate-binding protein [Chloroflexi bacterium]|nr:ABC transporter substrate-binding protein [Chloroflexota bacterium]
MLTVAVTAACAPAAAPTTAPPAATQVLPKATTAPTTAPAAPTATVATSVESGNFKCPKKGGTLTYAALANPSSTDPQIGAGSANARRMLNQIYDQLITPPLPGKSEFQPYLATKWDISADGLTYTFTLRSGVKFHDGTAFNSDAVKTNVERVQGQSTASLNRAFQGVTVETPNETAVVLKRKEVRATFLSELADIAFSMISPKVLRENPSRDFVGKNLAGTGPYKFVEFVTDDRLVLAPNTSWWGGEVCLDRVVFRFISEPATRILELEAGSVQVMDNVPPDQVKRISEKYNMFDWASCRVEGLVFNVSKAGPTSDVKFREAMRYALNQEAILKGIDATGKYNMETSWLSPKGWLYVPAASKKYLYDLPKAKQLWEAAGYKDTDGDGILNDAKTGKNVELDFPNGQFNEFFAQVMQGELQKVGIKANLKIYELNTFYNQYLWPGNYQTTLWNSQSEDCDPSGMFEQLRSTNTQNIPQLRDPKIDEMLDQGLKTADVNKRKEIYLKLIEYIEPMHLFAFVGEKYVQDNHASAKRVQNFRQDRYRVVKLDRTWLE